MIKKICADCGYKQDKNEEGIIMDKVCVPIASGTKDYTKFDNYMIKDDDGGLHLINPLNVEKIIE